jgi:hypothetical protein
LAHERVREVIVRQQEELGLTPEIQETAVVDPQAILDARMAVATSVRNVIARLPGTGGRKAVLLVAHYDSVATAPGGSDDSSGVAALLETARALRAGAPLVNDVILLFVDGEETGLLGSFHLHVSTPEGVSLVAGSISSTAPITAISLAGTLIPDPSTLASEREPWTEQKFQYWAPPAEGFDMIVEVGRPGRFTLSISDHRYGLPQVPRFAYRERPAERMPLGREFLPNSKTDRVVVSGSFVFGQ